MPMNHAAAPADMASVNASMAAMQTALTAATNSAAAATTSASSAGTLASQASAVAGAANTSAGSVAARVEAIEKAPYLKGTRGRATIAANIGVGVTVSVAVTFETALPAATYSAAAAIEGTSGLLGNLYPMVDPASKTATGCTVLVKNTSLLSLGQNAVVVVIAAL